MSEQIADFSLNHAGTTYTRNEAGQVGSDLNFLGDIPALIIAALVLEILLRKQLALSQDDMS